MLIDIDLQKLKSLISDLKETASEIERELIVEEKKEEPKIIQPLRDLNSKIKGAPNFRYGEFLKSETSTRLDINNVPDNEQVWLNIEDLASNVLQPIREEFGPIRITSGFRCLTLNTAIGGSTNSSHLSGEAADIEPYDTSIKLIDMLEFIYTKLTFRELIAEYFIEGWVHVSFRKNGNVKRLKVKDKTHNYSLISLDNLKRLYL